MNLGKLKMTFLLVLTLCLSSCSSLATGVVTDMITPDQGISLEAQVGDKKATLGNDIEVEAEAIQTVVGRDTVQAQVVNQTNVPVEYLIILMLSNVIGWMCPTPTQMWRNLKHAVHKD